MHRPGSHLGVDRAVRRSALRADLFEASAGLCYSPLLDSCPILPTLKLRLISFFWLSLIALLTLIILTLLVFLRI